jgi:hypothetical protein
MGWESTCSESQGFCSACDGCKQAATTQAPTTTTTTTTSAPAPIPPAKACGQIYYILGKSEVQSACFCYKLVMCDTLYQHVPPVSCSYNSDRCEHSGLEWNTVIGRNPVNSEDGMTQLYKDGTRSWGCGTENHRRKSSLTMTADDSKEELSVRVTEPTTACDYKVWLRGPRKSLLPMELH